MSTVLMLTLSVMAEVSYGISNIIKSCSHDAGIPGPSIKVPEAFHAEDPGLWLQGFTLWKGPLSKYVPTGPAVWTG